MAASCGIYINGNCVFVERDTEGCELPHGHEGPHRFVCSDTGQRISWEYDVELDCDVYWEAKQGNKIKQEKLINGL